MKRKVEHISTKEFNKKYGSIFKTPPVKSNKFNARKVIIGEKKFDSKSEGDYYVDLELQVKAGLIKSIETQVREEFWAYGKHICNYYVDFLVYHNDGTREFIEHKGMATPLWRVKWKLLLAKYDNEISKGEVKCSINWYRKKVINR